MASPPTGLSGPAGSASPTPLVRPDHGSSSSDRHLPRTSLADPDLRRPPRHWREGHPRGSSEPDRPSPDILPHRSEVTTGVYVVYEEVPGVPRLNYGSCPVYLHARRLPHDRPRSQCVPGVLGLVLVPAGRPREGEGCPPERGRGVPTGGAPSLPRKSRVPSGRPWVQSTV